VAADPEPLERRTFDAQRLMEEHPPVLQNPNKRAAFEVACPAGCVHAGTVVYRRWQASPLPSAVAPLAAAGLVEMRADVFDYAPVSELPGAFEWHVNFADPHLFVAYGSRLFAQDELQVAEHPILGALREALLAEGLPALTVEEGRPTPVLVTGAERRCRIALDPNAAEGRPHGLYGNAFARADIATVRRATTRLEPPTVTNLIAMAAPSPRSGRYTRSQIEHVFVTAFTAFKAAVVESGRCAGDEVPVVVHSGFWGCGAFGGNRTLMLALQALAAEMAGLTRLVIHTVNDDGLADADEALAVLRHDLDGVTAAEAAIERLLELEFEWGESNGT